MCAGIFVGATALQTYVQVFDDENALDRFEAFASLNGARFYGLKPNRGTIILKTAPSRVAPRSRSTAMRSLVFRGDEDLAWSIGEVRP